MKRVFVGLSAVLMLAAGGLLLLEGDGFGFVGLGLSLGMGALASRRGCTPSGWRSWEPFHSPMWGETLLRPPRPGSPESRVPGLVLVVEPCACCRCDVDLSLVTPCMQEDAQRRFPHAKQRPASGGTS